MMKARGFRVVPGALALAAVFCVAEMAEAQMRPASFPAAPAAKGGVLRIRRLPKPGRATMFAHSEFQTSIGRSRAAQPRSGRSSSGVRDRSRIGKPWMSPTR